MLSEPTEPSVPSSRKPRVLVVEDERSLREILTVLLKPHARIAAAESAVDALAFATRGEFDVAFIDVGLGEGMDGIELMGHLKTLCPMLEVVICSIDRSVETIVRAIRAGAFDYTTKDFATIHQAPLYLERAMARQRERRELVYLRSELARDDFGVVGGANEPMAAILRTIARAAPTAATILLEGESGTGKELMAHRIHRLSDRKDAPFVAVNLAAIPSELLESTLFGHKKGSFTGAVEHRTGKFELADGGTLFLDEVSELQKSLQAKVLRAIQEREIERVGADEPIGVDVRLIAATNVDLGEAVRRGDFREDLYYRLKVVPIRLPPLRERIADMPDLIEHFAQKHAARSKRKKPIAVSTEALGALAAHPFPGNVRELENLMERLAVLCPTDMVGLDDIPIEYRLPGLTAEAGRVPDGDGLASAVSAFERALITNALRRAEGNQSAAARELATPISTFHYKLTKLGLI